MNSLEPLRQTVADHPVLKCPFLKRIGSGQLSLDEVRLWFEQQFYLSSSLASAFAALFARVSDQFWQEKRQLANLIYVEAWGECSEKTHSTYFLEVASFLGIDVYSLTNSPPLACTKEFIQTRLEICLKQDVGDGLAAMALGNEYLNLFLFKMYLEGIRSNSELNDCPTKYFEIHLRDEEADFKIFAGLFDLIVNKRSTNEATNGTNVAIDRLLTARLDFFTALDKHLTSK